MSYLSELKIFTANFRNLSNTSSNVHTLLLLPISKDSKLICINVLLGNINHLRQLSNCSNSKFLFHFPTSSYFLNHFFFSFQQKCPLFHHSSCTQRSTDTRYYHSLFHITVVFPLLKGFPSFLLGSFSSLTHHRLFKIALRYAFCLKIENSLVKFHFFKRSSGVIMTLVYK